MTSTLGKIVCLALVLAPAIEAGGRKNVRITYGGQGNDMQGIAEVKVNGAWSYICSTAWDDTAARVVCREAGFPGPATAKKNGFFSRPAGTNNEPDFGISNVQCEGSEDTILDCSYSQDTSDCQPGTQAGVVCFGAEVNVRPLRLTGGRRNEQGELTEGNVEVGMGPTFGKICENGWDDKDAKVVCKQLGFSNGKATKRGLFNSSPRLSFYASHVQCEGPEDALDECRMKTGEDIHEDCVDGHEAGVICVGTEQEIRLRSQRRNTPENEGNAEIKIGNRWFRVCDKQWNQEDAKVFCRGLGYTGQPEALKGDPYGTYDTLEFFDFHCNQGENQFFDCMKPYSDRTCDSGTGAGIICNTGRNQ